MNVQKYAAAVLLAIGVAGGSWAAPEYLSHPPQRLLPQPSSRPMEKGSAYYVAPTGDDANPGTEPKPWRTLGQSVPRLQPGDTLCLRGGVYYENVNCSLTGAIGQVITIRSYPGERVVIDGGWREFFDSPATAWVSLAGGAEGEYRSAKAYRNVTGVAGSFGDSNIGLLTYWLLSDLRTDNETWKYVPEKKIMADSVYCGPGLWYDRATGYIHCRLAPTHNSNPQVANYRGVTDPRKLPLVIAPQSSVPLTLDNASHVRVQDLVLRGAGSESVRIHFCDDLELDGVIIICGGLEGRFSGPVCITNSAIYGRIPPWMWRIDSSKGCASGASRDIAQMLTDAMVETSHGFDGHSIPRIISNDRLAGRAEGMRSVEFDSPDAPIPQMVSSPRNHDWEIANCEFTDGHDGIFLMGANIRFHHNLVENMQDDAVDISCAWPGKSDSLFIHDNLIRRCVSAISTHNYDMGGPRGKAFVYRNIIDMSVGTQWIRATPDKPQGEFVSAAVYNIHGSSHIQFLESLYFYQNTCLAPTSGSYAFAQHLMGGKAWSERCVFNNIFVYLNDSGLYPPPLYGVSVKDVDFQLDGNLHWNPRPDAKAPANYFDKLRAFPPSEKSKETYPSGFAANDLVADPKFVKHDPAAWTGNDFRIQKDSPAAGKGVPLPAEWPDSARPAKGARPDIGAMPAGSAPLHIGIRGRIILGAAEGR